MKTKICNKCQKEKELSDFYNREGGLFGVRAECKICVNIHQYPIRKLYYKKNRKQILQHAKKYQKENRKRINEYQNEWRKNLSPEKKERYLQTIRNYNLRNKLKRHNYYIKNKIKNRSKKSKYEINKRKTNINYNLSAILRTRFYKAIKRNQKYGSAVTMLGCSVKFLKKRLESQFTEGMCWGNYGRKGWVIDHIKPFCSFDLSKKSEQKKVCHYTNLQPLWYDENNKKYHTHDKFLKIAI